MVEGLTTSAPDPGSGTDRIGNSAPRQHNEIVDLDFSAPAHRHRRRAFGRSRSHPGSRILVTLAERPYPFPSRTRKSSSPAPKILRGQPFGKIGRRQDLVLSGWFFG